MEEFAKNEYDSYILIDFSTASKNVRELFEDVSDLNYLFLQLQFQYRTDLIERKSLIILMKYNFAHWQGRQLNRWSKIIAMITLKQVP